VAFGEAFCQQILRPRANLLPSEAILDVGCGNGAVARALTRYLSPAGRYEGLDVHAAAVAWLTEQYKAYPNFRFIDAGVYNKAYNAGGRLIASEYRFPFADSSFDLVLLKSVFTHMLPADVHAYMREISRVLKPGGRSVITYFFLNDESRRYIERGLDAHKLTFEYNGDGSCRIANKDVPEAVVAHEEGRIRGYYSEVGCSVQELVFGNWSGRTSLLGHQDFVVAIKEQPSSRPL